MFERIKKNWQDWKDGAEDREKAALIRSQEREILEMEKARIRKENEEKGIIHCWRCGYDHHYTAACEEAIADNEGIDIRELTRDPYKSTGQRAQQSFISSIIFGVWK